MHLFCSKSCYQVKLVQLYCLLDTLGIFLLDPITRTNISNCFWQLSRLCNLLVFQYKIFQCPSHRHGLNEGDVEDYHHMLGVIHSLRTREYQPAFLLSSSILASMQTVTFKHVTDFKSVPRSQGLRENQCLDVNKMTRWNWQKCWLHLWTFMVDCLPSPSQLAANTEVFVAMVVIKAN